MCRNHNGLRTDAGSYLNVVNTVSNTVHGRFRQAVLAAVMGPLSSILSIHAELKVRTPWWYAPGVVRSGARLWLRLCCAEYCGPPSG